MLSLAAALSAATCAMAAGEEIRVEDGRLLLAQVVAQGCGLTPAEQRMTVASLPAGAQETRLTRTALAALARRRLPALAITLDRGEAEVRLLRAEAVSHSTMRACYETAAALGQGAPLARAVLRQTDCSSARTRAALVYDRGDRVVRAGEALASGAYVGALHAGDAPSISTGDPVLLRIEVGPVAITRQVSAAQSARPGEMLFVRDGDGHVFPAASSSGAIN